MDSEPDIETGLLPEVPELGQKPEKNWGPLLGFLYLLLIFGCVAVIILLVIHYLRA